MRLSELAGFRDIVRESSIEQLNDAGFPRQLGGHGVSLLADFLTATQGTVEIELENGGGASSDTSLAIRDPRGA